MEYLISLRRKENIIKILKMTVGAVIAIIFANLLSLNSYMTAGIITILSLQSTKKDTVVLALRRLGALALALLVAYVCFLMLQFSVAAFGLFLLLFSGVCVMTGMNDSISICAVLISQIAVAGQMDVQIIINQSLLFVIGAGIGILANLFVTTREGDIQTTQEIIDNRIRNLLYQISKLLLHEETPEHVKESLTALKETTDQALFHAEELDENFLLSDYSYYPKYLTFRRNQFSILRTFQEYVYRPQVVSEEERIISGFIEDIADVFHECNDASDLLRQGEALLTKFRSQELPKTRGEFESRAILYGQLSDIVSLLKLKKNFINALSDHQKGQFWIKCEIPTSKRNLP